MTEAFQQKFVVLRRRQVEARTGLARSTIYQYMKDGVFPKPVQLGPRAVGWIEADISAWISKRVVVGAADANATSDRDHAG